MVERKWLVRHFTLATIAALPVLFAAEPEFHISPLFDIQIDRAPVLSLELQIGHEGQSG